MFPGRFLCMKAKNMTRYSTVIILAGLVPLQAVHAIGIERLQQPAGIIQQRVEDRTERLMERAVERRADQSIAERAADLPADPQGIPDALLSALPERIAILADDGSQSFNDVRVEGGWRAVEQQWLVVLEASEINQLNQPGIQIIDQSPLTSLGLNVVRFRVAGQLDSRQALSKILPAELVEQLDRNHIYGPQNSSPRDGKGRAGDETSGALLPSGCDMPLTIGMVDTAIEVTHPSFSAADIEQKSFLGSLNAPTSHGTAVASVLVGQLPGRSRVQLPGAKLVNASVFFGREDLTSGATLMHLVEGLSWLVAQDVNVINISMAGPDNRLLAAVTQRVSQAGVPLIAAVGNHGPTAPALYPAAYPEVVGVTAVDSWRQIYRWANQGAQVDFAALGVDVVLAGDNGKFSSQSGTSLATPLITARFACAMANSSTPYAELMQQLARQAVDLGDVGRDPVFGHGLLK